MSEEDLEKCKERAFVVNKETSNFGEIVYLDQMMKMSKYFNYGIVPSVFVNENLVRGELEADVTIGAICDAMKKKTEGCNNLHKNMMEKNDFLLKFDEKKVQNKDKGHKDQVVIFFSVIALFIFILVIARRQYAKDIELEIAHKTESSLNEYYKTSELGGGGGNVLRMDDFRKAEI